MERASFFLCAGGLIVGGLVTVLVFEKFQEAHVKVPVARMIGLGVAPVVSLLIGVLIALGSGGDDCANPAATECKIALTDAEPPVRRSQSTLFYSDRAR